MRDDFDPYHKWLGIPPEDQPPHHYRLLGLKTFESDPDVIESAADRQMTHVKSHASSKYSALSQKLLNELSAAKVCLLNPEKKRAYDAQLRAAQAPQPPMAPVLPTASSMPAPVGQFANPATPRVVATGPRAKKPAWQQAAPWIAAAGMSLLIVVGAIWLLSGPDTAPAVDPIASGPAPIEPSVAPADRNATQPAPVVSSNVPQEATSSGSSEPPASQLPVATVADRSLPSAPPSAPLVVAATRAPSPSWTQGAVLALSFDEGALFEEDGQTYIRDLSGQGNHGTVHEAEVVPSRMGKSLKCASAQEFVDCGAGESLNPTNALSLAAWIKVDQWRPDHWAGSIINKETGGKGRAQGYTLRCGKQMMSFVLGVSSRWPEIVTAGGLDTHTWYHVAATFDGAVMRLFIDGRQVVEGAQARPISRSNSPLRIGNGAFNPDRNFLGEIDEVAVWNRALSAEEVRDLYSQSQSGNSYCLAIGSAQAQPAALAQQTTEDARGTATSPSWTQGAVLALAFDATTAFEQDGQTWARDLSGNNNHGRMHGAATAAGKAGEAVRITSKEQYVECADSETLNPAEGLTLTAWVNADAWRKDILAVIGKSSGLQGSRRVTQGYELRCPDNGRGSFVVGTSVWKDIISAERMSDQSWHHLAATYDRSKLRLYIDGIQVAEAAHERAVSRTTQPLRIGAHSYLTNRTFTGQIDEVAVWNRSLSPEEVRELYAYSQSGNSYCLAIGAASGAMPGIAVPSPAEVASTASMPPGDLSDLLQPGGARVDPKKLIPQPDVAALEAANVAIDQTYKAELAAAKAAPEKRAIAQKLYDAGVTTQNNPAAMFALLERAASLAAEAGDYNLARDAVDALSQWFAVDGLVRKEAALSTAARLAKGGDFARVAESWKGLADEALALDCYEEAKRFLHEATQAARKTTNKPLLAQMVEAGKDLEVIQAAYASTAEAQATLRQDPKDAAASAAWGRFLCLYKNNWDAGLPLLAAGQGDPLVELARQDLAQPALLPEQERLANAWWQAATAEAQSVSQKWLKARAALWYRRALPALSGLSRDLAKKRIDESAQLTSPFPLGRWVDVLGMVDLSRHRVGGEWARRGAELGSNNGPASRVMLPVLLDGSYDLELRYTPSKSAGAILPVGNRQCTLVVGTSDGTKTSLESVPNSEVGHAKIPTGQMHVMEIRVQTVGGQATIDATVDSRKVFHWQGAIDALSLRPDRRLPHESAPALMAFDNVTVFHSARLRLNSGTARLLEE